MVEPPVFKGSAPSVERASIADGSARSSGSFMELPGEGLGEPEGEVAFESGVGVVVDGLVSSVEPVLVEPIPPVDIPWVSAGVSLCRSELPQAIPTSAVLAIAIQRK
jgi:hypothetical protein